MKALYDLQYWQPSYTVAVFLVVAEHERIKRGDSKLTIEVMPPESSLSYKHWPSNPATIRQCMDGILKPMMMLLPSVQSVDFLEKRKEVPNFVFQLGHKYTGGAYFKALSAGVRPFRSPGSKFTLHKNPRLITITLRECGDGHYGTRDSDVPEWCMAAGWLERHGYKVVVVRDTRFADRPLHALTTDPMASTNLIDRVNLYESAAVNLFVSNGPAWFAMALDVPMLLFRPTCETANKSSRASSMAAEGIVEGKQMERAVSYQRLVWKPDLAENIVRETLQFINDHDLEAGRAKGN